jgi:hypothetical protein
LFQLRDIDKKSIPNRKIHRDIDKCISNDF